MRNEKRIMAAAMGIMMMAGCGAQNTEQNADNTAEQSVKKIGITQISDHPSLDNCRKGFIEGLKNKGYEEGKNLEIEFVSAQDDNSKNPGLQDQRFRKLPCLLLSCSPLMSQTE